MKIVGLGKGIYAVSPGGAMTRALPFKDRKHTGIVLPRPRLEFAMKIMEAARYLIYLSYNNPNHPFTPLKLQKLLYLAQGWSYVWDSHPLFEEEFVAWQYGPVNIEVYNYFKKYGRDLIPREEGDACPEAIRESRDTLDAVWDSYGDHKAFDLVDLTKAQDPWTEAYRCEGTIRNSDIERYFRSAY